MFKIMIKRGWQLSCVRSLPYRSAELLPRAISLAPNFVEFLDRRLVAAEAHTHEKRYINRSGVFSKVELEMVIFSLFLRKMEALLSYVLLLNFITMTSAQFVRNPIFHQQD